MGSFDNSTDFKTALEAANSVSDGYLIFAIPATIFMVLFFANIKYGRSKALSLASFATAFVLLFLNIGGLIAYWLLPLTFLLLGAGLFGVIMGKQVFGS